MKKTISIFTFLIMSSLLFGQNQERLSVHFFDLPESLESEFLKFNSEVNKSLENAGYGKDFYKLYKVKNDDKEKTLRYFQISSYTSDKHNEMTQDVSKDNEDLGDEMRNSDIGKKVWTFDNKTHIYRKVFRLDN